MKFLYFLIFIFLPLYSFPQGDTGGQFLIKKDIGFSDDLEEEKTNLIFTTKVYSSLTLDFENDMFYHFDIAAETPDEIGLKPQSDKNYTNGIRLKFMSDIFESKMLNKFLLFNNKKLLNNHQIRNGLSVYQIMYTPSFIDFDYIQFDDRPFAAAFLINYEFESFIDEPFNFNKFFYNGSIGLGVFGKHAYGYEIQKGIHEFIGGRKNSGWIDQQMKTDIAFDVKYKLGYQILKSKKHLDFNPYSIVNFGSIFNTLAIGTEFSYKVRKTNQDLPNPITYAFSGEVDTVFFTRNSSLSNQKKLKKVNDHIYKKNHTKTIEDIDIYDKHLYGNDSIPLIDSLDANVINFVLNTKYGAPVKKNKSGENKFKKKNIII